MHLYSLVYLNIKMTSLTKDLVSGTVYIPHEDAIREYLTRDSMVQSIGNSLNTYN